ncbi:unnamed protein product [Caenorhabditis bovis]|uniref:Cysteine dioxygenase n=1 Tax=Caenorhabditis bovis TaxID=2654633 RepID=A0A8S1EJH8_9PELO|nr:unnamed protein product [Caenorhabditis bovis]
MVSLTEVIQKIREIFEQDNIDIDVVMKLLESYKSNPAEWRKYAIFDEHKYTRNLVDTGNDKYNLMILCWGPGMASSIHDHTDAHCFVKMLEGTLTETKYAWPEEEGQHMRTIEENDYETNGVSYMSDKLGLHRMENKSHSDGAVSLHLYIPPYFECNSFDERTGHRMKCKVTFFSRYGEKVDYRGSVMGMTESEKDTANRTEICQK